MRLKTSLLAAAAFVTSCSLALASTISPGQVSQVVAFGDSLTDAGNASIATLGSVPGAGYAIGADALGNIYVVGNSSATSPIHWLTRKSSDGGYSWSTVDDYYLCVTVISSQLPTIPTNRRRPLRPLGRPVRR